MKVAVVILNYNGEHLLRTFLPSVVAHTPYDIYVVDNGSTDSSLEVLKTEFPTVKTVILNRNYGFAEGYNRGLKDIEADYFMLLNDDVEVTANWLEPLIELMDSTPECAVCQPKLLSYLDKTQFEYAGAAGGELDWLGYPFCRGRIFSTLETDKMQYDTSEIFWATGAALMIRKDIFNAMGGFDPLFFAHQEEIDLCFRIKREGYSIYCVTSSVCYHLGGATLQKSTFRKTFLNFRNNHLLIYKNYPRNIYRRVFISRLFLDLLAALSFLCSGKPKEMLAVFYALRAFRRMKKIYKTNRQITALPSGLHPYSILKEYHLNHHKKFSQLPKK
jgi:GT2 family glycosyltransferase